MLKDLRLEKNINQNINQNINTIDTTIACNLVDILFKHVLASVQTDRSSVKFNAFTRGMIGGVLGKTRDGTKEYVIGMRNEDIGFLLDDIDKELARRKKR